MPGARRRGERTTIFCVAACFFISTICTPEEREFRNLTHLPFASWCEICIKGRGNDDAHHKKDKDEEKIGLPVPHMARVEPYRPS